LVHTRDLAAWFLQFTDEYEVHVGAPSKVHGDLPHGCQFYALEGLDEKFAVLEALLVKSGQESTDWYHSQYIMLDGFEVDLAKAIVFSAMDLVEVVQPDVVVVDHAFNALNGLYTFCKEKKTPMVQITSMGRPETVIEPWNMCVMLWRYFSVFLTIKKKLDSLKEDFAKRCGVDKLIPDGTNPTTLLPSTAALVGKITGPEAVFTGPFMPLPGLVKKQSALERQSSFDAKVAEDPKLQEWLSKGDQSKPLIYVALGTLVAPTQGMLQRMVDGLDSDKWRIIWALPQAHWANLPKALGANWHLMAFAPQFALLESGKVSAFLSHCGAASTMESLCQGVPLICLPFFGDQFEWSHSVCTQLKAGVLIDKLASTPAEIHKAVETVLDTPMYRQNAQSLAEQMLEASSEQLEHLQQCWPERSVKLEKMTKVGVPVAVGVIDAVMNGKDPRSRLPTQRARKACC